MHSAKPGIEMVEKLIPENDLERLLIKLQNGEVGFREFFLSLLKADLFVPSGSEVLPDGSGMTPLVFENKDAQMIGVFTALSRAKSFNDIAPYCLSLKGREVFSHMLSGYGLVLNPGFETGFEIPPSGVKELIADFTII
jgi:hypothetical protein